MNYYGLLDLATGDTYTRGASSSIEAKRFLADQLNVKSDIEAVLRFVLKTPFTYTPLNT